MMRKLLERYGFPRAPEGEGGSGAAAGAAAGMGTGGDAGGGAGADGPGGSSSAGGGAASPGSDADAGTQPATPYFPEGLPEAMRGKSDKETLDKMHSALKGYRDKDAKRDIPADEAGYLNTEGLDGFKVEDAQKPYFDALKDDPAFKSIAKLAKEKGIGRRDFLDLWQAGMKGMGEAGLLEPAIDAKAERAELVPASAKALPAAEQAKAIDKRMQENFDFLDLMAENRGPKDAAGKARLKGDIEYAQLMLGDSAKGHRFFEFLRDQVQAGGGATGAGGGGGGGDSKESLRAELAKPEMTPGHPSFDKAKYADLQERYKKAHGA
jgi:hypothetical protein